jgi:hypothetical protein
MSVGTRVVDRATNTHREQPFHTRHKTQFEIHVPTRFASDTLITTAQV